MRALQKLCTLSLRPSSHIVTRSPYRFIHRSTSFQPALKLRCRLQEQKYTLPTSILRCSYSTENAEAVKQPLPHKPAPHRNPDEPIYQLTFTCKACQHRSSHTISKQGYHKGTVLITCPSCKNRHLISDHLHIFSDKSITLEDIMKDKGEAVKRGTIDMEGDVEFWADENSEQGAEDSPESGPKTSS